MNCSFFSFRSSSWSWSADIAVRSEKRCFVFIVYHSLRNALNEARPDRQLSRSKTQRLARGLFRHAVEFEHDAAGMDTRRPIFRRALALTHTHFSRLVGHGKIRENPDPHAALALHLTRDRASRRFDLPGSHALWLESLETELAEIEVRTALRGAVNTALELLTKLGLLGLQHLCLLKRRYAAASLRP
ncbi:hypothetical protein CHELA1G11_11642 [Hyphomicrobiales bacterium]|nr:hypothetical protein CHELA1G11_11642 [Hyphomicrobiales bacterium]CAH1666321.1 hypothetical protein CHELA1G2_12665 [Hyphomicrobiales bacterium]